ncbi:hypothetical protein Droror1_Dr00024016 [Drosera rotundifolia]
MAGKGDSDMAGRGGGGILGGKRANRLKSFGNQRRVDFLANGVWALKFFFDEEFRGFMRRYEECLFENTYGFEDPEDGFGKQGDATPVRGSEGLREEYEKVADGFGGIQSLAFMMLMSPASDEKPHSRGVHQLDIETRKGLYLSGSLRRMGLILL